MRDHVRDMIHRARQGTDAGRARTKEGRIGIEPLASEAIRLARVAAALHAAEAARAAAAESAPPRRDFAPLQPLITGEHTR